MVTSTPRRPVPHGSTGLVIDHERAPAFAGARSRVAAPRSDDGPRLGRDLNGRVDFTEPDDFAVIRTEVRRLCDKYGNAYWRGLEPDRYPEEFVADLTRHGCVRNDTCC